MCSAKLGLGGHSQLPTRIPLRFGALHTSSTSVFSCSTAQSIVVGMHEALPGSLGDSHSMSESGQGERTGRQIYEALHAQNSAQKHVCSRQSLALLHGRCIPNPYLEGQGTAGLDRGHRGRGPLPSPAGVKPGSKALTNVYGFMVAMVRLNGSISTSFQQLGLDDLLRSKPDVPESPVRWCYEQNKQ
jgi:hypothetical protein